MEFLRSLALLLVASTTLPAQATTASPTCEEILRGFRSKVEQNYAGMMLEITGDRRDAFDAMYAQRAREAREAAGDACFRVLDRFTTWFDDPHLFVFQSTRLDSAESARRAATMERRAVTEASARADIATRLGSLDPIEGVWYDGLGLRVAVLPDEEPGQFVAVVVQSDTLAWPVGAVRARITRADEGPSRRGRHRYVVALQDRNFALRYLDGFIHKEAILRLSPGIWAREYPAPAMPGLIDAQVPHRPTLVSRGGTVIVSMVSHVPTYRRVLDSLVAANDSVLRAADQLIIDLRGNEGGSSLTSNALLPYVQTRATRGERWGSDTSWMLSSPDQVAYAQRVFGRDTSLLVRTTLERFAAATGELFPLPASPAGPPQDTVEIGPRQVAIITDGGTVSAAEVLVLKALRSTRSRVYGQPTAGALDYQNVNVVRVLPNESRWFLGYPTITASNRLPVNGMRGKGLSPDVALDVTGLVETIDAVERLMSASPMLQ